MEKSTQTDKQNSVNLKQNTKDQNNNANDEAALANKIYSKVILPTSRKQLTSEYGEKYPADLQYAVDHISVDYKMNALRLAKVT